MAFPPVKEPHSAAESGNQTTSCSITQDSLERAWVEFPKSGDHPSRPSFLRSILLSGIVLLHLTPSCDPTPLMLSDSKRQGAQVQLFPPKLINISIYQMRALEMPPRWELGHRSVGLLPPNSAGVTTGGNSRLSLFFSGLCFPKIWLY